MHKMLASSRKAAMFKQTFNASSDDSSPSNSLDTSSIAITASDPYIPPHLRKKDITPVEPKILAREGYITIYSTDRIIIGDSDGKEYTMRYTINVLKMILPLGCKILFLGDLNKFTYVEETVEGITRYVLENPEKIPISIDFIIDILKLLYQHKFKWYKRYVDSIYGNRIKYDTNHIPMKYNSIDNVCRYFSRNIHQIVCANECNIFQPSHNSNFAKINMDKYYNHQQPLDDDCVFIYGNKEILFMKLLESAKIVKIDNNTAMVVIHKGFGYHPAFECTLTFTLNQFNAIYFYLHLCRIAYYNRGIMHIHYGGNISSSDNAFKCINIDDKSLQIGSVIQPSSIVCGHEKCFCEVTYNGVVTRYLDFSRAKGSYQQNAVNVGDNYLLREDDIYYIEREDGTILSNNKKYILTPVMDSGKVVVSYLKDEDGEFILDEDGNRIEDITITDFEITGDYDKENIYITSYDDKPHPPYIKEEGN